MRSMARAHLLLPLLAFSCDPSPPTEASSEREFLAFARDFEPYASWERFDVGRSASLVEDDLDAGTSSFHGPGARRVYLNHRPPAGAKTFPTGTIIVKELDGAEGSQARTFAMVKQGGSFNALGARGWRFFELARASSGQLLIAWQGFGPPAGESYGGSDSCNACHAHSSERTDSVLSPALDLARLAGGTP